jgi:tRNA (guanine10-N2)-methyltransferase
MHGRLVCWFPYPNLIENEDIYPEHTAMKLIAKSKQKLVGETSRILLTYEKISDDGKIVEKKSMEDVDFRLKYFSQYEETRKERQHKNYVRNMEEAKKRGKTITCRTNWKKLLKNQEKVVSSDK